MIQGTPGDPEVGRPGGPGPELAAAEEETGLHSVSAAGFTNQLSISVCGGVSRRVEMQEGF